ncbi:hypothetical protein BC332_17766 [Capsicum chinense]|uniref:Uncharacterized protein n=1 Tax=Capsicum annuum TaxID=4072 RepID=A0A1U8FXC2_CAPAN|nr:uncharacterized protein LOC107862661 [Capsicum annuum]KAF3658511.1 hypothetical protein FXO38_13153 [Capsicum annuum]KAF3676488.1 hypothetical protein FXO37_05302 [Capsicum annuum]PHT87970.1 hypothetical protein T459_10076 [Capsicum annuum]PHU16561.1 hypothetical protein BC332_17766 [Capsicum chinense]
MDVVMLSLRTARGLDLKSLGKAFGSSTILSVCEVYKPHIESGHVVCLDEQREIAAEEFSSSLSEGNKINEVLAYIRLSDPDGFLLSNELLSLAFNVLAPYVSAWMVQKLATPVKDRRLPILGCHQLIGVSKIYQDRGRVEPSIEQRLVCEIYC